MYPYGLKGVVVVVEAPVSLSPHSPEYHNIVKVVRKVISEVKLVKKVKGKIVKENLCCDYIFFKKGSRLRVSVSFNVKGIVSESPWYTTRRIENELQKLLQ